MNKFPVFEGTYPTVIVETSDHNAELTTYSKEKLHEVISFGLERWEKLERDKRFKSVLYFRNYGPGSGGSQRHPHSQIIGLDTYDYKDNIDRENFLGPIVHEDQDCYATVSDYPISGMGEMNVTLKKDASPEKFADTIQTLARYVLNDFPLPCTSYNIFFYHSNISGRRFSRVIRQVLFTWATISPMSWIMKARSACSKNFIPERILENDTDEIICFQ